MVARVIEDNDCFGPAELGYAAAGTGGHWFAKWYPSAPPRRGYKIHVTVNADDAEIAARCVLRKLRHHRIPHKVVRDLPRYVEQLASEQRGKFITIYLPDRAPPEDLRRLHRRRLRMARPAPGAPANGARRRRRAAHAGGAGRRDRLPVRPSLRRARLRPLGAVNPRHMRPC